MTFVTPEQHAAWNLITSHLAPENAAIIAPLLPTELTNPQPELPAEPGWYLATSQQSPSGKVAIELLGTGQWADNTDSQYLQPSWVAEHGPLTRLVPERPPIRREQVLELAIQYAENKFLYESFVDRVLALVNGTRA